MLSSFYRKTSYQPKREGGHDWMTRASCLRHHLWWLHSKFSVQDGWFWTRSFPRDIGRMQKSVYYVRSRQRCLASTADACKQVLRNTPLGSNALGKGALISFATMVSTLLCGEQRLRKFSHLCFVGRQETSLCRCVCGLVDLWNGCERECRLHLSRQLL